MSKTQRAWNEWNVPYFGGRLTRSAPAGPQQPGPADPGAEIDVPLEDGGARIAERVLAVLIGIGGVLAGFILFGFLLFMKFILSFGGSATPGEMTFAKVAGGLVAAYGILIAVVTWRRAGRPMRLRVDGNRLAIDYRTFSGPFEVSRELVRVVTFDPQPRRLFTNNKRFPIGGSVPAGSFKDQLDNYPAGPWEDLDPERHGRRSDPAVIWEDMGGDGRRPQGTYPHDEPEHAGWASGGSRSPDAMLASPHEAYLWSAHGSSLPFLRIGPGDVPNIAIIFHEPVRAPRTSWWFYLTPSFGGRALVRGGRRMRGVMLAVRNPHAAQEAFARWGIVRHVSAADVVEEGLLVAKPLVGVRVFIYGGLVAASAIIDLILRHRH